MVISNLEKELNELFQIIREKEDSDWNLECFVKSMNFVELKLSFSQDRSSDLKMTYIGSKNRSFNVDTVNKFIKSKLMNDSNSDLSLFKLLQMLDVVWNVKKVLWYYFFSFLDSKRNETIIETIIDQTNKIKWFPDTDINRKPIKMIDWYQIIRVFEYDPPGFFSPSRMFESFFYFSETFILTTLIKKLNDISFASLIAHGVDKNSIIMESNELEHLILNDYLRPFLLLYNQNHESMNELPLKLFSLLVNNYWETAGLQFFRLTYGNTNSYEQKFHIKCLENVLSSYIEDNLSRKNTSFIDSFSWYVDFQAFAGYYLNNGHDSPIFDVNYEAIMNAVSTNLLNKWGKCRIDYHFFVDQLEDYKFYDPLHPKNNSAMSLLSIAIFSSDKISFSRWLNLLKKILYSLKPYIYSSYIASHKACDLINFILLIHLSIVNTKPLNNRVKINLKSSLKLLDELILYPYLAIVELDEEVWNPERILTFKQFRDKDLFLINEYLIAINKTSDQLLKEAYDDFLSKWKSLSSTVWRWFD